MGRRRKNNPALCNADFIGEENDDDDVDESEEEADDSQTSAEEDSDSSESEEESDASDVGEEFEEEKSSKKAKIVAAPPPIKWFKEKVNVRFTGSRREFSLSDKSTSISIDANSPPIFEGDAEFSSTSPIKKSASHQIGGITITRYKNEFPIPLMLSTSLLPPEKHRSHDTVGNSGVFTFYPDESVSSVREEICGQIGDPESSLLSKYPGFTLENLADEITHVNTPSQGVKYSLIPKGHPLIEVFNQRNGKNSNLRPLKDMDGSIKASTQDTLKLIEIFRSETKKKVKGVNLYNSEFSIKRAFVSNSQNDGEAWTTDDGSNDDIVFAKSKEDSLDARKSLYVTFEIEYGLL